VTLICKVIRFDSLFLTMDEKLIMPELTLSSVATALPVACSHPSFESISVLDRGRWSNLVSDRFTPGKETRYPLYSRLGDLQGWS
jgi:hypothetical protein